MAVLQERLPGKQFLRVHKSYIISMSRIEKIEKHQLIIAGTQILMTMVSAAALLKKISKFA